MSKRNDEVGTGIKVFKDAVEACFDPDTASKLRAHAETGSQLSLRYKLYELLSRMTPENCPPETNWGRAVGKEVLGGDEI
ncbi:AbrB/MazE/SpoVT family DNA-binding domain-containing protein [Solimonas soli]|uniref:AbrB/MazE/SpoVT family DNA-binding domain-containing protein n=1 Tax=Solimonas soli TaxID=413479 RepID=UPI0012F7747F|nr:hypothetical protein [Solimonas soli]